MDRGRLDINDLLTHGYYRTARGRSPAPAERPIDTSALANVPSFLRADYHTTPSHRSRSRGPRTPPPPPPTVEDEEVSLAKEQHGSVPSYDPPAKGVIEQNPIILEADISESEAARLHEKANSGSEESNSERRYVFVPRTDTSSSNSEDDLERRRQRKRDSGKSFKQENVPKEKKETPASSAPPPLERPRVKQDLPVRDRRETQPPQPTPPLDRRNRQDLPALETKTPKEIPPQFRRSVSSFAASPKVATPSSKQNGDYFLSPETLRPSSRDGFIPSSSAPRPSTSDFGGRAVPPNEKRNSGSLSSSRPTTPNSDKRRSGTFDSSRPPSRRGSKERLEKFDKLTRPQQLAEESGKRFDRPPLPQRHSTMQSTHSSKYYGSSDDDLSDSDSDRRRRRNRRSNQLHPTDDRHLRSSSKAPTTHRPLQPNSRRTSPLPSPRVSPSQIPLDYDLGRSGTFPLMKQGNSRPASPTGYRPDQKLNPFDVPLQNGRRPHSRQSSQTSIPVPIPMPIPMPMPFSDNQPPASLPISIPSKDGYSSAESRRTPTTPQFDDRASTTRPQEKPLWQPPKFQPPTHLEKPIGSFRRYSEDVDRGVTPLAVCPRKDYVRGRNDWLTLPQCPGFNICPSCYNSTMAPTEFRSMFIPAPMRNPDADVRCDFGSSPWYRIAWLLTLKERRRDLSLLYSLAKVASTVQPCHGARETTRQWYSILDPKTGSPIRNFDVCYSCVKSIEVLLPSIRGIFIPTDVHLTSAARRVCDLRFDSKRFVQYFDAFETTADQAAYHELPPDIRSLASLVRRFAAIEECQRHVDLRDARWHIITQLPEFTVCPECFDEIVWPELTARTNPKAIALMFKDVPQRLPRASCQLYSARMRGIFRTAVDGDDYKFLASKARERRTVETRWKSESGELRRLIAANPGIRRLEEDLEAVMDEWKYVE